MRVAHIITDDDLDLAVAEAIESASPDPVVDRIRAAIDDPALRGDNVNCG